MSQYIKSTYEYSKQRKTFGRQPLFQDFSHILDSIKPNEAEQKLYILRNPVNRMVQATKPKVLKDTNTPQIETYEQGINHVEGGWPREVHLYNEDHVIRHRRRVQHEDNYINTVIKLSPVMTHYVNQNNAIDMYQAYFDEIQPQEPVEKCNVRTANVFCDPYNRPVSCVVWTHEHTAKLAVAYSDKSCGSETTLNNDCFIWDTSNQTEPIHRLIPEKPCWQLACSPLTPEVLVGGLANGTVTLFDIRESERPILCSTIYNSHRGPVTSLLYNYSRTHTEFFTGSTDGQCLWWDLRDLSKPLSQIPMSVRIKSSQEPNLSNAEGVSCLEFHSGVPTKFLCGTESGLVINANRMGKTHSEILSSYWNCQCGPVRAVNRSPCTLRMFLTCGDYSVRIWSEEVRTAPIIVTKPYRYEVTDAIWAPLRFSSCMSICAGGYFYYWDFLRKYREPVSTLQVSKYALTRITSHCDGESVAIGDNNGSVFLVQLSENMTVPAKHDKALMFQIYERETHREHILDTRLKEIHLKARAEEEAALLAAEGSEDESFDDDEILKLTEEKYFKIVEEELRQMQVTATSSDVSLI